MGKSAAQQVRKVVEGVAHELFEVAVVERIELHELRFFWLNRESFARQLLRMTNQLFEVVL